MSRHAFACVVSVLVTVGLTATGRYAELTGAQPSTSARPAFDGTLIYVSTTGSDRNRGTESSPVRTIQRGVALANQANRVRRDALVSIAAGIYRESIELGEQPTIQTLTLQGAGSKPEDVVITGADDWSMGWTRQNDGSYVHAWPYSWGMKPLPPGWDKFWATLEDADKDTLRRSEMLYVDGTPLKATLSPNRLVPGTFYVDEPAGKVHLYPPAGVSMGRGSTIEVGTRVTPLRIHRRDNVTLANLAVMRNRGALQDSSVLVTSVKNLTLRRVKVQWAATTGFGSAESTNINVQASVFSDNGVIGLAGMHDSNVTVEESDISRNNWRGSAYGMAGWETVHKWVGVRNGRMVRTTISNNRGNGFWLDTDNEVIALENSLVSGNLLQGVNLENNQGPIRISGNRICHNTLAGVGNAQSEAVTVSDNEIFENTQHNILFTGTYCGQRVISHRTGATTLNRSAGWAVTDNTVAGSGNQDLFTHTDFQCPGAWAYTRDSLKTFDRNRWFHTRDDAFRLPEGKVSYSQFKTDLERTSTMFERESRFEQTVPALSCTLP